MDTVVQHDFQQCLLSYHTNHCGPIYKLPLLIFSTHL